MTNKTTDKKKWPGSILNGHQAKKLRSLGYDVPERDAHHDVLEADVQRAMANIKADGVPGVVAQTHYGQIGAHAITEAIRRLQEDGVLAKPIAQTDSYELDVQRAMANIMADGVPGIVSGDGATAEALRRLRAEEAAATEAD